MIRLRLNSAKYLKTNFFLPELFLLDQLIFFQKFFFYLIKKFTLVLHFSFTFLQQRDTVFLFVCLFVYLFIISETYGKSDIKILGQLSIVDKTLEYIEGLF